MKIVTSGAGYIDIDAYAGCIAYAELLNLQNEPAIAASNAIWNESITPTIRSWKATLDINYKTDVNDTFVLVDVSNPQQFDKSVDLANVVEIIDHHPEAKQYWDERLGKAAQIEFVGAACTLVYERWKQAALLDHINPISAKLLTAGIIDNTLNFQATITTNRDRQAYAKLLKITDLNDNWPVQYFSECQQSIVQDVATALKNDTKSMIFPSIGHAVAVGQLVIWDVHDVLSKLDILRDAIGQIANEWFVNIVSIGEGKSYIFAEDPVTRRFTEELLNIEFKNSLAIDDKLWLRKEIMKADMEKAGEESR